MEMDGISLSEGEILPVNKQILSPISGEFFFNFQKVVENIGYFKKLKVFQTKSVS